MAASIILNYIKDIVFELDGTIYGESIYRYYMRHLVKADIANNIDDMTVIIRFPEYKYIDYFRNVISIFCNLNPYININYINMETFRIDNINIIIAPYNTSVPYMPEFAIDINNIEMTRRGLADNRANTNFYKSLDNIINGRFTYYIDADISESVRSDIYDRIIALIKLGYKCDSDRFYICEDGKLGECCTCSADFKRGELMVISRCNHKFHWDCDSGIKYWSRSNNTCPYCRCEKFV